MALSLDLQQILFINMATIVIQVDVLPVRGGGSLSLGPASEIISAAPSPAQTVVEDVGAEGDVIDLTGTPSDTPAPSRPVTPSTEGTVRPGIEPSLVRSTATLEAETPHPQPPVSKPGESSGAPAEASSSTTAQPATPLRNSSGGGTQSPPASRKRRQGEGEDKPVVKKEEPSDNGNNDDELAAMPYCVRAAKHSDDLEVDDDDVIEISPFKRRRNSDPDIPSYIRSIPRHRSESPSPLPPPEPFHHPDFLERPALQCPNQQRGHVDVICEAAGTSRNRGREYYRCALCPGFGGFICWADGRGIYPDNPRCDCGHPAREDITGKGSKQPDTIWYKCATNACGFRRYEWDDPLSREEVNAYCGREVYQL